MKCTALISLFIAVLPALSSTQYINRLCDPLGPNQVTGHYDCMSGDNEPGPPKYIVQCHGSWNVVQHCDNRCASVDGLPRCV